MSVAIELSYLVPDYGFRVSGSESRVSASASVFGDSKSRVEGFGISDAGFRVEGLGRRV